MIMQITGVVLEIFDAVQVTEKFKKREFVIKTNEQYTQEILIQTTQDKCEILDSIKKGELVDVSINLNGKGYINKEGVKKWFNSVNALKIDIQYKNESPKLANDPIPGIEINEDGLPF